jgi:hypothetical protein
MAVCRDFTQDENRKGAFARYAPENVLILDRVANPKQRAQMLKLCPGAKEHHFKSGGHMTMVNCRDEYFSALGNFWG